MTLPGPEFPLDIRGQRGIMIFALGDEATQRSGVIREETRPPEATPPDAALNSVGFRVRRAFDKAVEFARIPVPTRERAP